MSKYPGYNQVAVWPATIINKNQIEDFEKFMLDELNTNVKYLETIYTNPDIEDGKIVPGTGGRADVIFAIKDEDVMKFAIPRLGYGIRWIEDVVANSPYIYMEERVAKYLV